MALQVKCSWLFFIFQFTFPDALHMLKKDYSEVVSLLGNFGNMMDLIQKVQQNVQSIQEGLRKERLESSSGDVVHVVMNGAQEVVALHLNPLYLSPDNKAMLEDLLIACLNDASRQSRERNQSAMGKLTQDFNLPPISGLF